MKILNIFCAILYLLAIIFGILFLLVHKKVYNLLWLIFFGSASVCLLILSIFRFKNNK